MKIQLFWEKERRRSDLADEAKKLREEVREREHERSLAVSAQPRSKSSSPAQEKGRKAGVCE